MNTINPHKNKDKVFVAFNFMKFHLPTCLPTFSRFQGSSAPAFPPV